MKITDILSREGYSLSFEVFPPKLSSSFDTVRAAVEKIASLKPAFISVTYGAGGGTSLYTLELAEKISDAWGVPSLAHLTCVSSTRETVRERINAMKEAGIENVMALRGDLTEEMIRSGGVPGEYRHAIDLIRELKGSGAGFCIGGACYPEVHPESADQITDIRHLAEKVAAGCDFLTTQMFFDNRLLFNFLYKIREAGITVPVIPGIMPITDGNQLARALSLSGCNIPQRFRTLVDRFGSSPAAMKQAGIVYATDQIIDLFANGIRLVHVYTMNKPDVAERIRDSVSSILAL